MSEVGGGLKTARELAEYLGFSTATVLDMWERGELPGYKLGRAVRFEPREIETWLKQCHRNGKEVT